MHNNWCMIIITASTNETVHIILTREYGNILYLDIQVVCMRVKTFKWTDYYNYYALHCALMKLCIYSLNWEELYSSIKGVCVNIITVHDTFVTLYYFLCCQNYGNRSHGHPAPTSVCCPRL